MYTYGETFYYEVDEENLEMHVLENVVLGDEEYIVTEDYEGKIHVFFYDEDEDEINYVADRRHAQEIIEYWRDEYLIGADIGDYDDDEYYDREDKLGDRDYFDDYNYEDNDDEY